MRSRLIVGLFATATVATLAHCTSNDEARPLLEDGGWSDASVIPDGNADAEPGTNDDDFEIPDGSVVCDASPCAIALAGSAGDDAGGAFCVILDDKTVQCWGSNVFGRLGYETDGGLLPMSPSPHRLSDLADVTHVSIGGENACARIEDGGVYCWGSPDLVNAGAAREGGPPLDVPALPTPQDLVPPASSVAVGEGFACAVLSDGTLSCWGKNDRFQLAHRTTDPPGLPASVPLGDRRIDIAAPGNGTTFTITTSGELFSWGTGSCPPPISDKLASACHFLLGRDTSEDPDPVPTIVPTLSKVRAVAWGTEHRCAITGRQVACWGENRGGQLGRGTIGTHSELPGPTILSSVTDPDAVDAGIPRRRAVPLHIAASASQTCVVMSSGRIYCWGGAGPRPERGRPRRLANPSGPAVAIAVASETLCALLRSGVVECWGANAYGALGRGMDDLEFYDDSPGPVLFSH